LFLDDRYYKSINEMPLENWIQCTNGDLTYTRVEKNNGDKDLDRTSWEAVYDDYIEKQGLGKIMKKLLDAMIEKTQLDLEFIQTKDRFVLTQCEVLEMKLEQMLNNNGSGMSIEQCLIHISKWMGSWINIKSITTKEYFDLLNEFEKSNKKIKEDGKKNK
tara:strand:+ start:4806 stop:5285 length:480 start_codon:yes stop_codon:yes gene_type:complete